LGCCEDYYVVDEECALPRLKKNISPSEMISVSKEKFPWYGDKTIFFLPQEFSFSFFLFFAAIRFFFLATRFFFLATRFFFLQQEFLFLIAKKKFLGQGKKNLAVRKKNVSHYTVEIIF